MAVGLNLYDAANDTFLPVHVLWNLPGDAIASIQSDKQGELWLGTNIGLLRLTVPDDLQNVTYRLYTTADGLQDNIFNRGASCVASDGEMFFVDTGGIIVFILINRKNKYSLFL